MKIIVILSCKYREFLVATFSISTLQKTVEEYGDIGTNALMPPEVPCSQHLIPVQ